MIPIDAPIRKAIMDSITVDVLFISLSRLESI